MKIFLRIGAALLLPSAILAGCSGNSKPDAPATVTRTYYIAAEDVAWNYASTGVNQISGTPFANYTGANTDESIATMTRRIAFDPVSSATSPNSFTADPAAIQVGLTYKKSLYVEYTDQTFTTRKPIAPEWQHLGVLGPAIRAQVGDTIRIVFKNNTHSGRSYTVHPHGVFYEKPNEGASYVSGSPSDNSAGNDVPPGAMYTYEWQVPERAGPGPMDGPSVMWMYHSHVNEPKDENAGLSGPMIIYAKGKLLPDGKVDGVDREFVLLFKIFDETDSWFFEENLGRYAKLAPADIAAVSGAGGFNPEPHLKHTINGYLYGNLPLQALTMKKGERVRWYAMALGTEVDIHTPHWHGNTITYNGMRTDVLGLLPAMMVVADMVPDDIGTWLLHCHVNDHIKAGMIGRYRVEP